MIPKKYQKYVDKLHLNKAKKWQCEFVIEEIERDEQNGKLSEELLELRESAKRELKRVKRIFALKLVMAIVASLITFIWAISTLTVNEFELFLFFLGFSFVTYMLGRYHRGIICEEKRDDAYYEWQEEINSLENKLKRQSLEINKLNAYQKK